MRRQPFRVDRNEAFVEQDSLDVLIDLRHYNEHIRVVAP